MGAIEKTLEALDDRVGGACQVVAICGRNKALIERLTNRSALPPTGAVCSRANLASWSKPQRCLADHLRED